MRPICAPSRALRSALRSTLPTGALALVLLVTGCDTADDRPDPEPFDPSGIDYDALASLDYDRHVAPLLAARDVFSATETTTPGDPADYAWDRVFDGAWGAAIVPFDSAGSDLIRFLADLPDGAALPYPNLRHLQPDERRYLGRWIEDGARGPEGEPAYHDAAHLLFACVQGDNYVAVIDAERRRVIRTVHLDDFGLPSAPYGPHHIVFSDDGSAWYVSLISAGALAKFRMDLSVDPSSPGYLLARTPLQAFTTPGMMALDAHAGRLYVGRSTLSAAGTPGLGVFDPETLAPLDEFALPGYDVPHALALSADGRFVLTAPLIGRDALSVDARTGDVVGRVALGGANLELVHANLLADGHTATLTANAPDGTSGVRFLHLAADGALTAAGSAPTGPRAWHAHLDRDGRTLLVPNRAGHSVTLVDVPTQAVTMTAQVAADGPLAMPHSPAPTHGGTFFVSSSNLQGTWAPPHRWLGPADGQGVRAPLPNEAFGNVTALDAETGAVVAVIPLGRYPSGLEHWHGTGGHGGH